ncbi:hypothetical protein [Shewanella pealeana]|uniref:Lipoprotein n=1 Tax=Shewanella pealeana (strain ATCC 700345 / ANG-SQ1) TaxID=398579 RepID=A8H261_SHEPA|nr:hypothetical protein [Shewanella pealeana]ABV86648.1 hypothetical protein Spea_1321 [Shewanella pealeana ATCC 700345]
MLRNLFLVTFIIIMTGCASPQTNTVQGKKLLIVAGNGLNTTYEDSPAANGFLFEVGETFATDLGNKLEEFGFESYLFVSKDAATYKQQYQRAVNRLMTDETIDGVAEIKVLHTKDAKVNEIAIYATYFTTDLMTKGCDLRTSKNCYSVKTLDKIGDRKHLVVDQATQSFNDTPVSEMVTDTALFIYRSEL